MIRIRWVMAVAGLAVPLASQAQAPAYCTKVGSSVTWTLSDVVSPEEVCQFRSEPREVLHGADKPEFVLFSEAFASFRSTLIFTSAGPALPGRMAEFGISASAIETISRLAAESSRENDRIIEELEADVMRYLRGMEKLSAEKAGLAGEPAMEALAAREGVPLQEVAKWRAAAERLPGVEVLETTLDRLRSELSDDDWEAFRRFLLVEITRTISFVGFQPVAEEVPQ